MKILTPDQISFRAAITEDELRARLIQEVLEQIGALGPDGKPLPGVSARVLRGEGRKGGYTVTVSGPAPARLMLTRDAGQ